VPDAPAGLVVAVSTCLAVDPEDRPPSAAALARLLAPVASEADTLSLPADPAQRATEILAPRSRPPRRWTAARAAALLALVAVGGGGAAAAAVLTSGGHASPPAERRHPVAPPRMGTDAAEQARNLADWLRAHQG
jgi:ferric-dicitrate binding protein FerR (iron transport regulator)